MPSPDSGAPAAPAADVPPPDPVATATTDQSAGSTATAAQQQPVNLVVIVRVDSPGNDGPITQKNIAVAPSTAANDGSTAQSSGDSSASTSQAATAAATATQDAAGNLVITVRMDSAGTNGAVSQTNGVVGASSGTNSSDTAQQVAAPKPAVQPQARRAGAARSPTQARRDPQPTATAPAVELSAPRTATADVEPSAAPRGSVSKQRAPVHEHPAPARESRRDASRRPALSTFARGALQALSPILPQASPTGAGAAGPADVSRPVLLTLLLLVAAGATFALLRRTAIPRRAPSRRPPR